MLKIPYKRLLMKLKIYKLALTKKGNNAMVISLFN